VAPTVTAVLFSWTSPFSWQIWVLIAASLVFAALVMFVFEGDDRREDYGPDELALPCACLALRAALAVLRRTHIHLCGALTA
jgi:hypothetical protein